MKSMLLVSVLIAAFGVAAVAEDAGSGVSETPKDRESTQGYFVEQLKKELMVDGYLSGAQTLPDVAASLAKVGCVPDDGWKLDAELTLDHLKQIYKRLAGADVGELSPLDLRDKIKEALVKAFKALKESTERQAASPSRVHR